MFEKQLNQIYPSISISTSISFVNSAITLGKYSRLSTSIDFFFFLIQVLSVFLSSGSLDTLISY